MELVFVTIEPGHHASAHVLHTRAGKERISMKRSMLYFISRFFGFDRRENSCRVYTRWLRGMPHDGGGLRHFPPLLALILLLVFSTNAAAQQASISIYNDASRSSCSLSDANGGLIRAYVFVTAQSGFTGVRFSVPKPACFQAAWVADDVTPGLPSIGNSQTDISIATGICAGPMMVMSILFQKTADTTPCCELAIQPAVGLPTPLYSDCTFQELTLTPSPAYINGNATCACTAGIDLPPNTPTDAFPASGSVNVTVSPSLSWDAIDPEGGQLTYDLYFGTQANPPLFRADLADASVEVGPLDFLTAYHWKVVAKDGHNSTEGPVWTFTTRAPTLPPPTPLNQSPANGAIDQVRALKLQWIAGLGAGQTASYEIHLGTSPTPSAVATIPGNGPTSYTISGLTLDTTYYWSIVAISPEQTRIAGETWSFRTVTTNPPPSVPTALYPLDHATHTPTDLGLQWLATDPESQSLSYNVYFGANSNPPFVAHAQFAGYDVDHLATDTDYYWRVVAIDPDSAKTSGPVWTFRTGTPPPPPSNPSPVDGATDLYRLPTLKWQSSNQALHFVVRLGTSQSSGQDFEAESDSLHVESPLEIGRQYYWRVTVIDSDNTSTAGPWWTFTTSASNLPPTAPASPDPADHATGQGSTVMLQWAATDPEGLPLTYTVCFGATPPPPQIALHWPKNSYTIYDLPSKDFYWVIVAHDVDGNSTMGPQWTFHTGGVSSGPSIGMFSDASGTSCALADNEPGLKNIYVFVDGPDTYTGARFAAPRPPCFNATWMYDSSPYVTIGNSPTDVSIAFGMCMDAPLPVMTITYMSTGNTTGCCQFKAEAPPATGRLLVTDCSFAELTAAATPMGISSDNSCASCQSAGLLHFAAIPDSCCAGVPHRMTVALDLSAAIVTDNASVEVVISPSLQFIGCERGDLTKNWTTFNQSLNGDVLTLSASGGSIPAGVSGSFALLTFETDCCQWTTPAELGLTSALGDFQSTRLGNVYLDCRYPASGDVDYDGNLTLADAQCALESYLYWPISSPGGCGRLGASMRADVNCSETPTPGDACCIYRQLTDQSCTFCNGDVHPPSVTVPQLGLRSVVENQDVVVVLSSSVTSSITSMGLELTYPKELQFVRVEAPRSDVFAALQTRVMEPGRVRIGGFANSGTTLSGDGDLIAIRFHAKAGRLHGAATALKFVDDLAGASSVSISLENTIGTPVPDRVVLHQNSPNPFNPQTTIQFDVPSPMHVRLSIYDVHGRLVKELLDEHRGAGPGTVSWDGTDAMGHGVATGVYFYVLDADGARYQRKMVLLK
jgi:hypothetical protein